jgi:hypothetical protein
MTRDDAITITRMILNSWAKPDWTDGQTETYVNALVPYDADDMTQAVVLAHRTVGFRPPFNELLAFYRMVHRPAPSRQGTPPPPPTRGIPLWVKRWVCARYLHDSFGKPQDMRVFPEQREWRDPADPLMPPGEWEQEAASVSNGRAWALLKGQA